jgi:hypothetical protein
MEHNKVTPDNYFVVDFDGISHQDIKKGEMFGYIYKHINSYNPRLKHFFSGDKLYVEANPKNETSLTTFINWLMNFMNVETATLAPRRNNTQERLENFVVDGITSNQAESKTKEALQKFKEHNPLLYRSIGNNVHNSEVKLKDIKAEQTKVEMIKGFNLYLEQHGTKDAQGRVADKQAYFPICLKGYNKQHGTPEKNVSTYIKDKWFNGAVTDGDNIYILIPQNEDADFKTNMNNLLNFCCGTEVKKTDYLSQYKDSNNAQAYENFKLHNPFFSSCYSNVRNTDIAPELARQEVEKMQNLYAQKNNVHLDVSGENGLVQNIFTHFVYNKNNPQNQPYTANNNNANLFDETSYYHNLHSLAQFLSQDPNAITKILESDNVKHKYSRNDVVAALSSLFLQNPGRLVDVLNGLSSKETYDKCRISESLLDIVANVFSVTLVSPFNEVVIADGQDEKIILPYSNKATSITRNMNFLQIPGDIAKIRSDVNSIIKDIETDNNADVDEKITKLQNYWNTNCQEGCKIWNNDAYIKTIQEITTNLNACDTGEKKLAFLKGLEVVLSQTQDIEIKNDDKNDKLAYSPTQKTMSDVINEKSSLVKDDADKTIDDLYFEYFSTRNNNILEKINTKKEEMDEEIELEEDYLPTHVVCDEKDNIDFNGSKITISTHGTEVKNDNGKITIKEASYPGSYYSIKNDNVFIEFNQPIIGGDSDDTYKIKNNLYKKDNINIDKNIIHSLHFENDLHIKFNNDSIFVIYNKTSYQIPQDIDLLNCTHPEIITTLKNKIDTLQYLNSHQSITKLNTALNTEPKINATLIPENFRNEILEIFNDPNANIDNNAKDACKLAYYFAELAMQGKYPDQTLINNFLHTAGSNIENDTQKNNIFKEIIKFALKFPIDNQVSPINPDTIENFIKKAKQKATGTNIINTLPDSIPEISESFDNIKQSSQQNSSRIRQ